jgi:aerobic-type carbon monoxide dehydrogenase small subunit (CoxS/CutS family)
MSAKVLLDQNPHPTDTEIKQALNGVLCRCASYLRIVRAIQRAANADQSAPPIINYR